MSPGIMSTDMVKKLKRDRYDSSEKYSSLYPVAGINVLDFLQFTGDIDPLRHFLLYDITHRDIYGSKRYAPDGLLSLTFLELSKPKANVGEQVGLWMDFFSGEPLSAKAPDYLQTAIGLVDEQDLSQEEVDMIDKYELGLEDQKARLAYAREEGYEVGKLEGRNEERESIAINALRGGFSPETVATITCLEIDEIRRIAEELN